MLDLNYLYSRHQISVMRASAARSTEAAMAHAGLAAGYALEIQRRRDASGAGSHPTTFG